MAICKVCSFRILLSWHKLFQHTFLGGKGCLITSALYIVCKLCERRVAIVFPFYKISSSNFAGILILVRCFQLWRYIFVSLLIFKVLRSLNLSNSCRSMDTFQTKARHSRQSGNPPLTELPRCVKLSDIGFFSITRRSIISQSNDQSLIKWSIKLKVACFILQCSDT